AQLAGLAALSQALQRRRLWRPALQTLKTSLALRDDTNVRAAYDKLRATRGFRMLDYTVDADAAAPRLCVQFSEKFKNRGAGIENFVLLNGARPPAVTVEAQQICVDGLSHGQRYRLTLRSGLPSDVGETIETPIELTTYVRDRSPAVRFTGNNYVLPRVGAKGIPVVTINTDLVQIDISRIGDRGLAGARRDGRFLQNLTGYQAEQIAEQSGVSVWNGEMPVAPKLNREVVTAFPIDEVLKSPEPGIYVMIARIRNDETNDWDTQATQWFVVSDLGLAALSGRDGVHLFVRSLASAAPIVGATARLIALNNEILGTGKTDARGHVRFAAGLARGTGGMAPAMVSVQLGDDFALLEVDKPGFDLTDRGVDGRAPPGPVDVFAFTERGVYRPGAIVHLVALARDGQVNAATTPLTFIVRRPDGVEYVRQTSRGDGLGGHNFDIALSDAVMTGTWTVSTYTDPKAAPLAQTKFLVEDFVPERIDFTLKTKATEISAGAPATITLAGRYLYGAPASGLRLEGEIIVRPAKTAPRGFSGYNFGLADEELPAMRAPFSDLAATDTQGNATLTAALPPLPETTRLLEAEFIVRMRESGGRAVERTLRLPVASGQPAIGIKPMFGDDGPGEGQEAGFTLRVMGADGTDASLKGATWELVKIERNYQWYRLDGRWNYEPTIRTSRVANGTADIIAGTPAKISVPVKWGRYRIEVAGTGADAPLSALEFSAGWYGADATSETPDVLSVALDRPAYQVGDTARLRLSPRYAGKALVTVMGDRLLASRLVDVPETGTDVALEVGDDWGAGAYVSATLYRPMDTSAGRNPARAMGLQWLTVSHEKRRLTVTLDVPETLTPRTLLQVPVTISGLAPGQQARLTLAAVDVGILNLTRYKPPAPEGWYFGQRRLGMEIRDLYGKLIDGMQGVRGRARSGAGEAGLTTNGAPKTEKAVALFSGIVEVGTDGKATVALDIPQFNGTLKLMAVAWSKTGLGQASTEMIVRDPVVLSASLPRFLAPGDTSRLRLEIANVEGPAGNWALDLGVDGPVQIASDDVGEVPLGPGQTRIVDLALTAGAVGISHIAVHLTHPDGTRITRELTLGVRAPQTPITRRSVQTLAGATVSTTGGSLTLSDDLFANLVPGTGSVTLTVSNGLLIDTPGLLSALDRYPYGCSEQITSRALPLLYLNQVASRAGIGADRQISARIETAIAKILQRQGANGSIGLWRAGGEDLWLDAYVADFLTRAKETGFKVPGGAFTRLLDRLENSLSFAGDVPAAGREIAYALYVLARNSRASIGDLRYFVDTKLDEFSSPLAKAQLASALVIYGDTVRAKTAFAAAFDDAKLQLAATSGRSDFGSRLRDGAAVLTLATEGQGATKPRADIINLVEEHRARVHATSTQENAWLLLAV
ncbi:MAG: alpha-2-macroglobulin family protein, partial [Alphaproteobacteria bacterium]